MTNVLFSILVNDMSIFDFIKQSINEVKDYGTSTVVKKLINNQIEEFGELTTLNIDSNLKHISASLKLKGESERIRITMKGYQVIQKGDNTFIKLGKINVSREWLESLINNFLIPKSVPDKMLYIDPQFRKYVDILL